MANLPRVDFDIGDRVSIILPEHDYVEARFYDFYGELFETVQIDRGSNLRFPKNVPQSEDKTFDEWSYSESYVMNHHLDILPYWHFTGHEGEMCAKVCTTDSYKTVSIRMPVSQGATYLISWGDGGTTQASGGQTASHTYQVVGEFLVSYKRTGGTATEVYSGDNDFLQPTYKFMLKELQLCVDSVGGTFADMQSLCAVSIVKPLTITNRLFQKCVNLRAVAFRDGTTCTTDSQIFAYSGIEHVRLPRTTQFIAYFAYAYALKSLCFPDEFTGLITSNYCSSLKEVYFDGGSCAINNQGFRDCVNLEHVSLPENATIGNGAFYGCYALESINLPASLTAIPSEMFFLCHGLREVVCEGVTSVGVQAFSSCESLRAFDFPMLESVGDSAFQQCLSLEKIILGEHVTSIGRYSFCSSEYTTLREIYSYNPVPPTISGSNSAFVGSKSGVITTHVPSGCISTYKSKFGWNNPTMVYVDDL